MNQLPGHIPGIVNEERWRIIDRAWDDIGEDGLGRVRPETWAIMSERDRALFAEKGPRT